MNFIILAEFIIEYAAGKENITNLIHCATRLRFTLKNNLIPDTGKLKKLMKLREFS